MKASQLFELSLFTGHQSIRQVKISGSNFEADRRYINKNIIGLVQQHFNVRMIFRRSLGRGQYIASSMKLIDESTSVSFVNCLSTNSVNCPAMKKHESSSQFQDFVKGDNEMVSPAGLRFTRRKFIYFITRLELLIDHVTQLYAILHDTKLVN